MKLDAIKDKCAIIGMGCTKFGENWDQGAEDMAVEAAYEAYADAGVEPKDIEALWVGNLMSMMNVPAILKFDNIPVTRVEHACATGSDAVRNACHAVAAGLYDVVMAIGVEKLKDTGYGGLGGIAGHPLYGMTTAPGDWALGATGYFKTYGLPPEVGKRMLAMVAVKNHDNAQHETPLRAILVCPGR